MRVLLMHNRYRAAGGEERAVADIAALLAARGHDVELIERSSAGLGRTGAARALLAGGAELEEIADAIDRFDPDVVHVHNLHPLFGWRALAAAREQGVRTVLHLHNFRVFCAIGIAYRDGAPCFRCHSAHTLAGLRLRCRGSVPEAAVYAAALKRTQPRLFEYVDQFAAVSTPTAARLTQLGLPADRVTAIPNFVSEFAATSTADEGRYVLAVGRLVEEKGFDTAIAAARKAGVPLVVVGDGPAQAGLRRFAAENQDVRFTGRVSETELAELRAGAAVALLPSRWEEPCPYAVLDAMAAGVPVLASSLGGLPELVGAEPTLPPGNVDAWADALGDLWADPLARRERGNAMISRAREQFGEDRYYERLLAIYRCEP